MEEEMKSRLMEISQISVGLSGRALRKIPFLTYSLFLKGNVVNLDQFLEGMKKAIQYEFQQRSHFEKN